MHLTPPLGPQFPPISPHTGALKVENEITESGFHGRKNTLVNKVNLSFKNPNTKRVYPRCIKSPQPMRFSKGHKFHLKTPQSPNLKLMRQNMLERVKNEVNGCTAILSSPKSEMKQNKNSILSSIMIGGSFSTKNPNAPKNFRHRVLKNSEVHSKNLQLVPLGVKPSSFKFFEATSRENKCTRNKIRSRPNNCLSF